MPEKQQKLEFVGIGLVITLSAYLAFAGYFVVRSISPSAHQFWLLVLFIALAPVGRVLFAQIPDAKARKVAVCASLCDLLFAFAIMLIAGGFSFSQFESAEIVMVVLPYLAAVMSIVFSQRVMQLSGENGRTLKMISVAVIVLCPISLLTNSWSMCSAGVLSLTGMVMLNSIGGLVAVFNSIKTTRLTAL